MNDRIMSVYTHQNTPCVRVLIYSLFIM